MTARSGKGGVGVPSSRIPKRKTHMRSHPRTQIQVRLGSDGGIVTCHSTDTSWIMSDKMISPRLHGLATDSRSSDVLPSWCSISEMTTNSPPAAVIVGLGTRL